MIVLQATTPSLDAYIGTIVVAILSAMLALGGTAVWQLVNRNWTQSDKAKDQSAGASNRELDRIWETLKGMQDTQREIQNGLLRVELRVNAVEGYAETQMEIARLRGRMFTREQGQ